MKITYWNLLTHIYVPIWRSISFAILGIPLGIRCHLTALNGIAAVWFLQIYLPVPPDSPALAMANQIFNHTFCRLILLDISGKNFDCHLIRVWKISYILKLLAVVRRACVFGVVRDCLRPSVGGKCSEQRCLRWWRYHLLHYWLGHTLLYCSWSVGCI